MAQDRDAAQLAKLGYKQEFKRDFGLLELFGLGFSIIGVVPSIASVMYFSIPYGGPVAMVWGWFVCSFFLMFIAMAMAELGSSAPTAGGVYYWTYRFSSLRTRNYMCWIMGYINTITYITAVAGFEWGCAVEIMAAVSIGTGTFVPTFPQIYGVYVGLLLLHAIICSLATKFIAKLQILFVILNVGLILAIYIALPAHVGPEFKNTASFVFTQIENFSLWPTGFAFILSFLAPLWTVGGFDAYVHISEEARNAQVAVPRATILATGMACLTGWGVNIALAFTMGQDIGSILQSPIGQPFATMLFNSLGAKGSLALWCFITVTQFTMTTSILTTASRQMFAFSRDGALPFSKFLYYVSPTQKIPIRTVWACAFVAALIGLIALAGQTASGAIFAMSVVGQYICNATVIASRFLGGSNFEPGPFYLGVLSAPVSTVAVLFMSLMALILLFPSEPQVGPTTMNYTVVVIGGVILLSTIYYFFPVVGGRYWFKGPVITTEDDDHRKSADTESGNHSDSEKEKPPSY